MTLIETILTVGTVSLGTMITRFLPFMLFPADKPTPKYIQYLGRVYKKYHIFLYKSVKISFFSDS